MHILIAKDEAIVAHNIAAILENFGYTLAHIVDTAEEVPAVAEIAVITDPSSDVADALRRADAALYQAKPVSRARPSQRPRRSRRHRRCNTISSANSTARSRSTAAQAPTSAVPFLLAQRILLRAPHLERERYCYE